MSKPEFPSQQQGDHSLPNFQFGVRQTEVMREQCEFCTIPETRGTELFRKMYNRDQMLNIPNLPQNFTVMQDLVPIAEKGGHVLLMPNKVGKGHDISLATVNDQKQLMLASSVVATELKKIFPENPIFIFEHGPGFIEGEPIACGGCHLDHAHGHMLLMPKDTTLEPIKKGIEKNLAQIGWDNPDSRAEGSSEIFTNIYDVAGINPYLHIGMISPEGNVMTFTYVQKSENEYVESQSLRRVLADVVYSEKATEYWHWREISSGNTSQQRLAQLQNDIAHFREATKF
jgi:diadenosine tetraphosphate (Ap4A) HIT family hydrolase